MERKHEIRPTRCLYRCVTCDVWLTSLSAHYDCPGPASNKSLPSVPVWLELFQLGLLLDPEYHGMACAIGIPRLCTSSRPTAAYGDLLQFVRFSDPSISRSSPLRYNSPRSISTSDLSHHFPVLKTSWRHVFHNNFTLEYQLAPQHFGNWSPSVSGSGASTMLDYS
ncbi:hypothetical protein MRX96_043461 [Rhipicephalus microplus]